MRMVGSQQRLSPSSERKTDLSASEEEIPEGDTCSFTTHSPNPNGNVEVDGNEDDDDDKGNNVSSSDCLLLKLFSLILEETRRTSEEDIDDDNDDNDDIAFPTCFDSFNVVGRV